MLNSDSGYNHKRMFSVHEEMYMMRLKKKRAIYAIGMSLRYSVLYNFRIKSRLKGFGNFTRY